MFICIYVVERSLTHHLYSSDFIQRTQLNAAHYTSHFGKCSGSLAGPEIRGNCSEVSFHILNFEAIHSKIVWFRQGNMWPRKEIHICFDISRLQTTFDLWKKGIPSIYFSKGYIIWCICKLCLAFQMGLDWGWEVLNSWSSDSWQLILPISA